MTVMLIQGDCLDVLSNMTDKECAEIDLVFADLPYGSTQCRWDTPIPLNALWSSLYRIRRLGVPVILFAQTPFDKVLGASNIQELRYEWIWEKTHPTGHLNSKKMPMKAHENILVFGDEELLHENILVFGKTPVYNPQKTKGHKRKTSTKRFANGTHNQSEVYGDQIKDVSYDSTERYPRSVLIFPSDKQTSKLHPTQKPVALCEYIIKTYTNEGGTVLDFCMGSGTTGIACLNTGRSFVGIENDTDIFYVAKKRIDEHVIKGTAL